jgi:hypothetical protein
MHLQLEGVREMNMPTHKPLHILLRLKVDDMTVPGSFQNSNPQEIAELGLFRRISSRSY